MRGMLVKASLLRHRTRTMLAVFGIAVAAAMLLDMVMLSGGMRASFRELLLSKGFQLRISPKGTLPFDTDATIARASEIEQKLSRNPDIAAVSPVLGGTVYVPRGDATVTSFALGVHASSQGDYEVFAGHDAFGAGETVANDELLRATGKKIGDTLDLVSGYDAQLRTYAGRARLRIVGRARFLYAAADQIAVAMPLGTLQAMGGARRTDRVSLFMVKARNDRDVEHVRAWIEREVPRVTAISTQTALAQVDERLSYFRQLAFILGAVSLFVGFLLVTTLMTVSVNERVGEITVMRAIGVSRWHIVQQIVMEGAVMSIAGALLGLLLGVGTARYLNRILADFPGLPARVDFFLFQPGDAWTALGMLAGVGVLAGIYPAWRAASMPIATTLRQEAVA